MKLVNKIGLIGDFIGTIPVMIHLASKSPEGLQVAGVWSEIREIFGMIPSKYKITEALSEQGADHKLDLEEAFRIASVRGLHMTQAHFAVLGLDVPDKPVRPELEIEMNGAPIKMKGDYIISPFSRSLPEDQRWPSQYWQELVDTMDDKQFILLGSQKRGDDFNYIMGDNVSKFFDCSFNYVAALLENNRNLIGLVSGLSHMAYALNVNTWLLAGQTGAWGLNPEATMIPVAGLKPEDLIDILKKPKV